MRSTRLAAMVAALLAWSCGPEAPDSVVAPPRPESTADAGDSGDDRDDPLPSPTEPEEPEPRPPDGDDPEPEPPAPDGAPEDLPPASPGDFSAPGAFEVEVLEDDGPRQDFTLYQPANLETSGFLHPVVTWGNGTGGQPQHYGELLEHLASHGFVVIASNRRNTGSGEQMLEGVDWLLAENERDGSPYFGAIDADAVAATGHSQGGGGAIAAGADPRVRCVAPLMPTPGEVEALHGPMFVVAGSRDSIVMPWTIRRWVYEPSEVPTIYGELQGEGHLSALGAADGIRGPLTAWLRLNLVGDESARSLFYGDECGLCVDPAWEVERKNL